MACGDVMHLQVDLGGGANSFTPGVRLNPAAIINALHASGLTVTTWQLVRSHGAHGGPSRLRLVAKRLGPV